MLNSEIKDDSLKKLNNFLISIDNVLYNCHYSGPINTGYAIKRQDQLKYIDH